MSCRFWSQGFGLQLEGVKFDGFRVGGFRSLEGGAGTRDAVVGSPMPATRGSEAGRDSGNQDSGNSGDSGRNPIQETGFMRFRKPLQYSGNHAIQEAGVTRFRKPRFRKPSDSGNWLHATQETTQETARFRRPRGGGGSGGGWVGEWSGGVG